MTPDTVPWRWHGAGNPVLLIAGLANRGTSWQPFLSEAARRHRVLTYDGPGSGHGPRLDGPIAVRDLATHALRLLDALELEAVPVIGRSFGGMVAQELALLAPHRVSRLVLVSTTGRSDAHLREVFCLWARMAELGLPAELRRQASLLWCVGREALEHGPRLREYLRARSGIDRPTEYALLARAASEHDALARLGRLRTPTLVVGGGDDRLTPPAHGRELAGAIPGARLQSIPGAGHLPYLEAPQRFADVVLDFLEEPYVPRAINPPQEATACPNNSTQS